ncbi:MAG: VWA domain-containing protein [Terriglobia bacterium]|nr:MAG: VWA domain-containing protein [Terriglobia bacterium]
MRKLAPVLLISLSLTAQQADSPATFKTTTNLVIVDVFVRGKGGKAVENLKKEDFTVLENGKPQQIGIFDFQRIEAAAPAATVQPRPTVTAARANAITADAPGKVKYRDKRLLVLFFDFSSMQPQEQIRAQQAALKFLTEQMTPADLVAIMTLASGVQVAQDFTDDRDRLTEVIKSFRIGDSSELSIEADTGDADSAEYTGAAFAADETEFNIFNTDRKLIALETAVRMLSALPEKKALVYFSSGIPKTGVENHSQLESAINAAIRANVSFYPVDARGLVALAPGGDASKAAPRGTAVFTGQAITKQKTKFNDQQETLFTLAEDTGGKALLDNNDLSAGIQQAQEDLDSYYVIGYYPAETATDGRYRRIQVSVSKQYQAQLEYRPGYYAAKEFGKFTSSDKEKQLQEALLLGDPVTDLPLALEINYFRLVRDRFFVPVAVKIPGSEISTARRGGADTTEFDFIGQVLDLRGRIAANVRDTIRVRLGEGDAAQLGSRNIQYDTGFTLTPGQYRLKFLARENQSGKMGTFETGFTVPNINVEQSGLRVSSVVWSGQREPVSAAIGSGANQKLLVNHPLVSEGQKLVPSITRTLSKKQSLYVYFEIYDPAQKPETKKPLVLASVTFYRRGIKAFESNPVQLTSLSKDRTGTLPVQFQVPLARLQPGRYTCQVNVIDEAAKKFEFLRGPLVVLP